MAKSIGKTLLEKILGIKSSAKLGGKEPLIDEKSEKEDLPEEAPIESPEEQKSDSAPSFEEIVSSIRDALADPTLEEERHGSVSRVQALADSLRESAGEREGAATKKSDEVYSLLASLGERQSAGYDELADFIKSGDYLSTPAAKAILEQYLSAAGVASDNAIAESASDNAGNPDSYGAANAHRQKLAYTDAGTAAALDLYERQADRLAKLLSESGDGLAGIYSQMQDNAGEDYDHVASSVDAVSELLSELLTSNADEKKLEYDAVSKLYDKYDDGAADSDVSPMSIDKEYDELKREGLSGTDALIELWKVHPDMREYIVEKYKQILGGDSLYIFKN